MLKIIRFFVFAFFAVFMVHLQAANGQGDVCLNLFAESSVVRDFNNFKSKNPIEIPVGDFDEVASRVISFYKENYSGRNLLIFTDASWEQKSGVVTVMKVMRAKIQEMTGINVVYVTPEDLDFSVNTKVQDVRLAYSSEASLRRMIERVNPVAVHVMVEGSVGRLARNVLNKMRIPSTTAYHTDFPQYIATMIPIPSLRNTVRNYLYKNLRQFHSGSPIVMAPTKSMAQILKDNGFDPAKIGAWSHGVDTELFKFYSDSERKQILAENMFENALANGLTSGKIKSATREIKHPISLYVGRIEKEKNLEDFLKLNIEGTKILIGDGAERLALEKKYPEAVFLGRMEYENLPKFYASADAFVFTSTTDTFGLVLLEAISTGTPVLAYEVQGPVDVVPPASASGVLVPYNAQNPAANRKALEEAFPEVLRLGHDRARIRQFAEANTWEKSIVEFLYFLSPL